MEEVKSQQEAEFFKNSDKKKYIIERNDETGQYKIKYTLVGMVPITLFTARGQARWFKSLDKLITMMILKGVEDFDIKLNIK
jgi:hypothetical protein